MPTTLEAKVIVGVLAGLALVLAFALFCIHLINAGKAEANSVIEKERAVAVAQAATQTAQWTGTLADATTKHQKEIDALTTQFVATPVSAPVVRYLPSPTGVPASSGTPNGPSTPSGGSTCAGVLPESPAELQDEFDAAKRDDILVADYRLLYNGWPVTAK